jgi:serine/threonine-protein kinase
MRSPILAPTAILQPGARVAGKYRLMCRIAEGGMGEVWRARNEATHADVALKIARHGATDVDARFRTEARLGSMLSHRSIVRIFDLVEHVGGSPVLVMELLRGESLAQRIRSQGPLSTEQAVAIALPILSALSHAHAEGVLHRDVSPTNVILAVEPDGEIIPKLIDFGIAKMPAAGDRTDDGRVLGTPRYMSPEQIRGEKLDPRADLFSLAVVLYESITGTCPFAAASASACLAAVLETQVDADPRIEPRVWYEIKRALSKRPYERHPDADAMAAALRVATGQSDAWLGSRLRGAPPRREADSTWDEVPMGASVEDVPDGAIRTRRRAISMGRLVGACVATLLCAGVVALAVRHRPSSAPSSPPAANTAPTGEPAQERAISGSPGVDTIDLPRAAVPSTRPPNEAPTPAVTAPTRPTKAPTTITRPARAMVPRPIGTTPGF